MGLFFVFPPFVSWCYHGNWGFRRNHTIPVLAKLTDIRQCLVTTMEPFITAFVMMLTVYKGTETCTVYIVLVLNSDYAMIFHKVLKMKTTAAQKCEHILYFQLMFASRCIDSYQLLEHPFREFHKEAIKCKIWCQQA